MDRIAFGCRRSGRKDVDWSERMRMWMGEYIWLDKLIRRQQRLHENLDH